MSNYKSKDNSTENTSLREWWGIVRAEISRIFEILTQNEEIITVTKSEVNSCTDVGLYHVINGENEIGGSEYYVLTSKYSGVLGMPEVRQFKIDDKVYVRTKRSTSKWSEWTEIGAVGEFTSDGGIIFSEESKALSPNAVAMGPNCIAGGKGFKIVGQQSGGTPSSIEILTFPAIGLGDEIVISINEGDTKHIIKSINPMPASGSISFMNNIGDIIGHTQSFPHEVDLTYCTGYYKVADPSAFAGQEVAIELERVSNSTAEGIGTYTLSSTEGIEVGMTYSVKLSTAKYNAGTITAINGNDITVDGYTYIEPNTEEDIASATSEYFRSNYLTIVGRPDLGDMEVGFNAVALGEDCIAQDRCTVAMGYNNKSIGQFSTTLGMDNIAGYGSFVSGRGNEGNGTANIMSGQENIVNGSYNEVSGMYNKVLGGKNEVNGGDHNLNGDYNSVNGQQNTITGNRNDVSGYKNTVTTNLASARGRNNTVTAENGDAQGVDTIVSGYAGHTEGGKTKSSGNYSHARNYNTKANGARSTAAGFNSEANGETSTAIGKATIANGADQTVLGRYNKADNTSALIIGNGSSSERNNAFSLDWNGNGWFAGDVIIQGEISISNFIRKAPKKTTVKCHVGDTVPVGSNIFLREIYTSSGLASSNDGACIRVATGDYIFAGSSGDYAMFQGEQIEGVEVMATGENLYGYDENWYAVFEVGGEGTEDALCITSPNGSVYKLAVDNDGKLSAIKVD